MITDTNYLESGFSKEMTELLKSSNKNNKHESDRLDASMIGIKEFYANKHKDLKAIQETATDEPHIANAVHDMQELKDTEDYFSATDLEKAIADQNVDLDSVFSEILGDDDKVFSDPQVQQEAVLKNNADIYYNKDKFESGETNLCFILGLSGSGKSSMANGMTKNAKSVAHCDMDDVIFNKQNHDLDWFKSNNEIGYKFFSGAGSKYFLKHDEIKPNLNMEFKPYAKELTNKFIDFAIQYANSHKNTKFIIEGVWLYRYCSPSKFKPYAVCIKGTSATTSMVRAGERDKDMLGKVKKAGSWLGDDQKLNSFRSTFNKPVKENAIHTYYDSSDINSYMAAYESYVNNTINNESKIAQALILHGINESDVSVVLEANIKDDVKAVWLKFQGFMNRIIDKFSQAMEKITLDVNKRYLEKYKDTILNNKGSESLECEYTGDYKEAIDRCKNTPMPVFNYERDAPWLRQDGYEGVVSKDFMAGKNFKYNADQDLATQFKNYFLAAERGVSKGKFSNLNFKEIYDFCYNYGDIQNTIKKDQASINQTTNILVNAVNKEMREKGENPNENSTTNPQQSTTPSTNTNPNGSGTSSGNSTGSTGNTVSNNKATNEAAAVWLNINEAEGDNNNNNGNNNNEPKAGSTGLNITNTDTTQTNNANGNATTNNNTGKANSADQDMKNIANKWTTICRYFCTAKLTAIQQISRDYMNIIRAHVKSQNNQNDKQAANGDNNQQNNANIQNTNNNQNNTQQNNNNQNNNQK